MPKERGILGELLRAIHSLYIMQAAVRTREGETDWFEVKCGLRQGCLLSPLLFIIFMDNITKRANQEENSFEELMLADDLVLIAEDQSRMDKIRNEEIRRRVNIATSRANSNQEQDQVVVTRQNDGTNGSPE